MRPIQTDPPPPTYSEPAQRARPLTLIRASSGAGGGSKRRIEEAETISVETRLGEFDAQIAQSQTLPAGSYADRVRERIADELREMTGYEEATRPMIEQTGAYCAYCDARVASDLRATPVLPMTAYPTLALAYNRLLLACPACRNARRDRPARGEGTSSALLDPTRFAWPHLFWQSLHDGDPLPFRYQPFSLVMNNGELILGQSLGADAMGGILYEYRSGRVWVERSDRRTPGVVMVGRPVLDRDPDDPGYTPSGPRPVAFAVLIVTTNRNQPIGRGVDALLDLFKLNEDQRTNKADALDRRVELRTMAYLRALDFKHRLSTVRQLGDAPLFERIRDLMSVAVQATGFWGVWLSVFRDDPAFLAWLAGLMPGTAPRAWVV